MRQRLKTLKFSYKTWLILLLHTLPSKLELGRLQETIKKKTWLASRRTCNNEYTAAPDFLKNSLGCITAGGRFKTGRTACIVDAQRCFLTEEWEWIQHSVCCSVRLLRKTFKSIQNHSHFSHKFCGVRGRNSLVGSNLYHMTERRLTVVVRKNATIC